MRLGEMLLATGILSARELEAARAHQRSTGVRLGSALIELGLLEADDVARALARQHGVPAALTRHLRDRDRTVTQYLSADLARNLHALPVALSRGAQGTNLVVCFRDPDPDIIAEVAHAAGMPVIPAVACERLLERELLHSYPQSAAVIKTPPLGSGLPQHGQAGALIPPVRVTGSQPAVAPARTSEPMAVAVPAARTSEPMAAAVPAARTSAPMTAAVPPARTSEPMAAAVPPARTSEPMAAAVPPARTSEPMAAAVPPARTSEPMAATVPPARSSAPMAATPAPDGSAVPTAIDDERSESYDIDVDDADDDHGFGGLEKLTLVNLDDRRVSRDHSQNLQLPALHGRSTTIPPSSASSGVFRAVTADSVSRVAAPPAPAATADGVPRVAAPAPAATADGVQRSSHSAVPAVSADGVQRSSQPAAPAVTADGVQRSSQPAVPAVSADGVQRSSQPAVPAVSAVGVQRSSQPAAPAVTADGVQRSSQPAAPAVTASGVARVSPSAASSATTEVVGRLTGAGGGSRPGIQLPPTPTPASPPPVPPATATSIEGSALCTGPRDPVAERYLPHLIASWRVAMVLAVEPGLVSPRTGVGNALTAAALEGATVSLAVPSILRAVVDNRRPHIGDAMDANGAPRDAWLQGLTTASARELAVAPVIVGDRVIRLVVAVGARLEIGAASGEVIRVARMMTDAYLRGTDR